MPVVRYKAGNLRACQRELSLSQYWSPELLKDFQERRLRTLLVHAVNSVPRFRGLLGGEQAVRNVYLSELQLLPFMTKKDIQSDPAGYRSTAHVTDLVIKTTGGSTGQPVTIWKTRTAWCWELAATWRGYDWAGIGIGDPQARFWGVPFDRSAWINARVTDFVCNRQRLSAFGFDDETMSQYVSSLRRFRPRYFYGYVSMLAEFADFLERGGSSWRPDLACVITTSEVLTEPVRRHLETVFNAPVFNEYGCGELGTIAHECDKGRMHLSAENMIVEILDGDRVCAVGETGEIVVTELNNTAMPLVRYRLGDYGRLDSTTCPCGVTLPVLAGIHGRAYDMVRNRQGNVFHGEFLVYIFEEIKRRGSDIKQFQVIQEDIGRFRIRIVPGTSYGEETRQLIRDRIRRSIDLDAEVIFEEVEVIAREPSGKMRLIVGLKSPGG